MLKGLSKFANDGKFNVLTHPYISYNQTYFLFFDGFDDLDTIFVFTDFDRGL